MWQLTALYEEHLPYGDDVKVLDMMTCRPAQPPPMTPSSTRASNGQSSMQAAAFSYTPDIACVHLHQVVGVALSDRRTDVGARDRTRDERGRASKKPAARLL